MHLFIEKTQRIGMANENNGNRFVKEIDVDANGHRNQIISVALHLKIDQKHLKQKFYLKAITPSIP